MAENKKNQIEEQLQDEQLDEVSGGVYYIRGTKDHWFYQIIVFWELLCKF